MNRLEHIQAILEKNNQPKFRFVQIKTAIFSDNISRYSQISNIAGSLKEQIISALGDRDADRLQRHRQGCRPAQAALRQAEIRRTQRDADWAAELREDLL